MILIKLLTILAVFHLACGFVQVSVNYFGGDMADGSLLGRPCMPTRPWDSS